MSFSFLLSDQRALLFFFSFSSSSSFSFIILLISSYFSWERRVSSYCYFDIICLNFSSSLLYSLSKTLYLSAFYLSLWMFYSFLLFSSFNCSSNLLLSSSISFWLFIFSFYNYLILSIIWASDYFLILSDRFLSLEIIRLSSSSSSSNFLNNFFLSINYSDLVDTSSSKLLI